MTEPLYTLTLASMLEEHARSYPAKLAVTGDEGESFTYVAFNDRVNQLANALEDAGFAAGDRLLWLGQNSFRILEGLLACAKLGGMICPVNWRQSEQEIAFVIDDLKPFAIVRQDVEIGSVMQSAEALAIHKASLVIDKESESGEGYEAFLQRADSVSRHRSNDINAPVLAMYTAAFGGSPNAALISQRAFIFQGPVVASVSGLSEKTTFLNSGPLFHIGTLKFTMATFFCGGTNAFVRRTDPEAMCMAIENYQCTFGFLATQTMEAMIEVNASGRYNLKSFISDTVSPKWDAMVTLRPQNTQSIAKGYGQTEVCGFVCWGFFGGDCIGNAGRPSPFTRIRLLDDEGNEVSQGETGEFCVQGPTVMNGYWNRPELNAQRQQGGWHHCNDLGRMEADGSYTFVGPKTQMIKSGIENIYPAEVESCLNSHPAVAESAVIGVPDEKWIQSVKAIVKIAEGASVSAEELKAYCGEKIASYKKPRFVEFTDQIPRLPSYAIDYATLDDQYGGGGYPGGSTRSK